VSEFSAGSPPRAARPDPPLSRGSFFRIRVGVLLVLLGSVLAFALRDYRARRARQAWRAPLEVAIVLLERGSVDRAALAAFEARVPALEDALTREFARYGGSFPPFRLHRFGPIPEPVTPPEADPDPGPFEPVRISFDLWRYARKNDELAGVPDALGGAYDGKVYVVLSAPRSSRRALVEGLGQEGGRIAVAHIELSQDSVDFGLFVVAHELFHLLGADDRYGPDGNAILPDGLGDPDREPLYPQDGAEIMARGRVIEPGREAPPGDLVELRVGEATAREIGWLPAQAP
jgi:hypothetical protein